MKRKLLLRTAFPVSLMVLAACSEDPQAPVDSEIVPKDLADDRNLRETENSLADSTDEGPTSQAAAMPPAMMGRWHINNLGRAPKAADCDPERDATRDYDRLITVREGGYGYFETGGRIADVHNRSDRMIDATFDTTYADTPTSERRVFALQPDGSLAVKTVGGDGVMNVTQYFRCPE